MTIVAESYDVALVIPAAVPDPDNVVPALGRATTGKAQYKPIVAPQLSFMIHVLPPIKCSGPSFWRALKLNAPDPDQGSNSLVFRFNAQAPTTLSTAKLCPEVGQDLLV